LFLAARANRTQAKAYALSWLSFGIRRAGRDQLWDAVAAMSKAKAAISMNGMDNRSGLEMRFLFIPKPIAGLPSGQHMSKWTVHPDFL
jgi:hypothetical protein